MNRENKYKGLCKGVYPHENLKDTWVVGDYVKDPDREVHRIERFDQHHAKGGPQWSYFRWDVYRDSVGQYAEIEDDAGVSTYEGDLIVKSFAKTEIYLEREVYEVILRDGVFGFLDENKAFQSLTNFYRESLADELQTNDITLDDELFERPLNDLDKTISTMNAGDKAADKPRSPKGYSGFRIIGNKADTLMTNAIPSLSISSVEIELIESDHSDSICVPLIPAPVFAKNHWHGNTLVYDGPTEMWCRGNYVSPTGFGGIIESLPIKRGMILYLESPAKRMRTVVDDISVIQVKEVTEEDAKNCGFQGQRCTCKKDFYPYDGTAYACESCMNTGWYEEPEYHMIEHLDHKYRWLEIDGNTYLIKVSIRQL